MNDTASSRPSAEPSKALPTTALVLGIVSIFVPLLMVASGVFFGIVAINVGAVALSRVRQGSATGLRRAVAGIVCGVLGILSSVGIFIIAYVVLPAA